jgi:hypothetical protein
VIYGLVQDTRFSVLVAAIFHISVNFINLFVSDVTYEPSLWVISATVWAIVAAIFMLLKRELYLGSK